MNTKTATEKPERIVTAKRPRTSTIISLSPLTEKGPGREIVNSYERSESEELEGEVLFVGKNESSIEPAPEETKNE